MLPVLALLVPALAPPFNPTPETVDSALPNVLLIGDSISIGYTVPTRDELAGEANLFRIPTNGGPTTKGLKNLDNWLGDRKWDVIHVNWGLHDLKYMNENGARVSPEEGTIQVPPEEYSKNLGELFDRLQKTGAKLIWATTTPVPEGASGRVADDSIRYNKLAAEVLQDRPVAVDDLHAYALQHPELQRKKDVHFTNDGSKALAKVVAEEIRKALPAKAAPAPIAAPATAGE